MRTLLKSLLRKVSGLLCQQIDFFKDKGMKQIVEVGDKVKTEMDKFKPNLPLMVALRKDGMKDRHWK